ncbi:MAG: type I-U CRISPR-associated protein Cas5/Cas6 [Candidatus Brocadiae bacterium]|nr:type I-U CRISPR-associated protein Csb2 [Myxococcota bacterium]NUN47426.1 type I-U CRISPR-associated protein Cas5/Cas6 [Candidatus Brocadiia bacterium]
MIVLVVELLAGRYVATSRYDREEAEWPPHPDRLFSALVAAWKEGEFGDEEGAALKWLEAQPPPRVRASDAHARKTVATYVPVNDTAIPQAGRKADSRAPSPDAWRLLPGTRPRKERRFPTVVPEESIVRYGWADVDSQGDQRHVAALGRLAAAVGYLGHSSTPVRVALGDPAELDANWVPDPTGPLRLRVPVPGRIRELEESYSAGERPIAAPAARYSAARRGAAGVVAASVFGEAVVYRRVDGPRIPLHASTVVTGAVRDALICHIEDPVPEVFSGHGDGGAPSQRPHLAVAPLANVGHDWADGAMAGFALLLPRETPDGDVRRLFAALTALDEEGEPRFRKLAMGRGGAWSIERVVGDAPLRSLSLGRYERPSRRWASVTPVVLDRWPKDRPGLDPASLIRRACAHVELPEPARVHVGQVSPILGVAPASHFIPPEGRTSLLRPRVHAVLEFEQEVRGPLLLGAGRYLGLGLFTRTD